MADGHKWAFGLLALTLLGVTSIHFDVFGASYRNVETDLSNSVREALAELGDDGAWAQVDLDGQVAVVSGPAPGPRAQVAVREAILSSTWAGGGVVMGGVTKVNDLAVAIAPPRSGPYAWSAELGRDVLALSGLVPSSEVGAELSALAARLFPGRDVTSQFSVDASTPDGVWPGAARAALNALARLEIGEATLSDAALNVVGEAGDTAGAEAACAAVQGLTEAVTAACDVTPVTAIAPAEPPADPTPAPIDPGPAAPNDTRPAPQDPAPADPTPDEPAADTPPDVGPIATIDRPPAAPVFGSQEDCQIRFDAALAENMPTFTTGGAGLDAASIPTLNRLAEIADTCAGFNLRVEGHTDSTGDPQANTLLSERRAQAVVEYLAMRGVAPQRLSAIGFGQSRPIATNETSDGRALNRRVKVVVWRPE